MFISRVEIDFNNRQRMRELSHLGAYHNWVEEMFPEEIVAGKRTRKLWRIDSLNERKYLLVISETVPNPTIMEKYGVEKSAQIKSYTGVIERVKKDQAFRFKVTLNPVVARSSGKESGKRGKIYPHVTETQQISFFMERTEKNGFVVVEDEVSITEAGDYWLRHKNNKASPIRKVTYEGRLTVVDETKFKAMLTRGLGKKKAYGCGMMTIIPVE